MENAESQIVVTHPNAEACTFTKTYEDGRKIIYTIEGISKTCLSALRRNTLRSGPRGTRPKKFEIALPEGLDPSSIGDIVISASKDGETLWGSKKAPILKIGTGEELVERTTGIVSGAVSALEDLMKHSDGEDTLMKIRSVEEGVVAEIVFLLGEIGDDEDLEEVVKSRKWSVEKLVGLAKGFLEMGSRFLSKWVMGDKKS